MNFRDFSRWNEVFTNAIQTYQRYNNMTNNNASTNNQYYGYDQFVRAPFVYKATNQYTDSIKSFLYKKW